MVFCIIGIVLFGILGIFSAKYRSYFFESLNCIRRQITLKPCDTDLDNKMKAKLSGKLMKLSPRIAGFAYRRFAIITWAFIILMFLSIAMIVFGIYNYWAFGNCNGPESSEFCIFNLDSTSISQSDDVCTDPSLQRSLLPAGPGTNNPFIGPENASVTVTEFGCYACRYTKRTEPIVKEMLAKYGGKIRFVYRVLPLSTHNNSRIAAEASYCAWEQKEGFWHYHDNIFESQNNLSKQKLIEIASSAQLNVESFEECFNESKYASKVEENIQDSTSSGIFGTPTFFINERYIVGPKNFGELSRVIDEELKK